MRPLAALRVLGVALGVLIWACTPEAPQVTVPDASTAPTGSASPGDASLRPYGDVLSVGAMPGHEIVVFVGDTGPNPDAQATCDAMFLDRDTVVGLTGVEDADLSVSVLADGSGVRCEYHSGDLGGDADGNGDGRVEVVSAYVGLVSDGAASTLAEVPVRGVVETPDGLSVREARIDPEFLDDVDPATNVDLYDLESGTRVSVAVSTAVDRGPEAARTMLDLLLDGIDASTS